MPWSLASATTRATSPSAFTSRQLEATVAVGSIPRRTGALGVVTSTNAVPTASPTMAYRRPVSESSQPQMSLAHRPG